MSTIHTSLSKDALPFILTERYSFLVQPGYQNSGEGHWQTQWELLYPGHLQRIEQNDWEYPVKKDWIAVIDRYVQLADKPVILLAHSLGCIAFAQWATLHAAGKIAGALLVAPADAERSQNPVIKAFSPVPFAPFPFPSIVVASTNDPCAAIDRQAYYAASWGSRFISVGNKGHINAASRLGHWEEGLYILSDDLVKKMIEKR